MIWNIYDFFKDWSQSNGLAMMYSVLVVSVFFFIIFFAFSYKICLNVVKQSTEIKLDIENGTVQMTPKLVII